MRRFARGPFAFSHPCSTRSGRSRKRSRRGSGRRPAARGWQFESLEQRIVLDAYTWIGGSGDWFDSSNWLDTTTDTNAVPGSNFDNTSCAVTIDTSSPATITIAETAANNYANSVSIGSLNTGSNDKLSIGGGEGITIGFAGDANSTISGPLVDSGGQFDVTNVTMTVAGAITFSPDTTNVYGNQIEAQRGATVNLSALATGAYAVGTPSSTSGDSFEAYSGSTINLPALTTLDNAYVAAGDPDSQINMPVLTSLTNSTVSAGTQSATRSGATVDIPEVTTLTGDVINEGGGVGTITDPKVTDVSDSTITVDGSDLSVFDSWTKLTDSQLNVYGGTYTLPNLSDIDGTGMYVIDGGKLTLAGVTSYVAEASARGSGVITAGGPPGAGSLIALPALATVSLQAPFSVTANFGEVDLPALTSLAANYNSVTGSDNFVGVKAVSGGTVNISGLTSLTNQGSSATLTDTGSSTITDSVLATLNGVGVTVDGTDAHLADAWTTFTGGGLTATGGTTNFPALTSGTFTANGSGGTMNFPVLASATISSLSLSNGGTLDLPVLTSGKVAELANGASVTIQGTVVAMPADGTSNATINVPASNGLTIALANFGTLTGTTVNVGQGTTVDMQSNDANGRYLGGTVFNVGGGAIANLAAANGPTYGGTLTGSGAGTIDFNTGVMNIDAGGATLEFPGNMFQWSSGPISAYGNVTNSGTINLSGDNTNQVGSFNNSTFTNTGTIRKTSGTGTSILSVGNTDLDNTGTIEADSGTLSLRAAYPYGDDTVSQISTNTLTGGTWNAFNGATLQFPSGTDVTANQANIGLSGSGATITGIGNLTTNSGSVSIADGANFTTSGAFTNSGMLTLSPAGTLTVAGDLTLGATGTVVEQIAGTPASSQFGRIATADSGTLGGTFHLDLTGGYSAAVGEVYPVVKYANAMGSFNTVSGLPSNMSSFQAETEFDLVVGDVVENPAPVAIIPTEGATFSGALATFTGSLPTGTSSDFTASIDWGDNSTANSTVSITGTAAGGYSVIGTHTYADEASKVPLTIVITDVAGNQTTITNPTNVADAPLTATAVAVAGTEGSTFNGAVATFTDANPAATSSDYTATIDWGDKSTPTTVSGSQITDTKGVFSVPGSHVYSDEGTYTLTVTIADVGGSTATVNPVAKVVDATLSATASAVSSTEGGTFSGTVATFTDANPLATSADYMATIDWGDKSAPTTVSGSQLTNTKGTFGVAASHVYGEDGTYTLTVTIADVGGSTATLNPIAKVADAMLSATASAVSSAEGVTFSVAVATFTDANPAATSSDYTATIDWGDKSTPSTVSGSQITDTKGTFSVPGSHVYAEEGTYRLTVTIADVGGSTATVNPVAKVADATLSATASAVNTAEGSTYSGTVATFTDANPAATTSDYTVTIDWGDKSTRTTVSGSQITDANGTFGVAASHVYTEQGTYTLTVTIADGGGATATVNPVATVADASLSATASAVSTTEGSTYSGTVATFTDANPSATASDYTATIDWGDNATTTGTIATAAGGFAVTGAHAYAAQGTHTITVTIADEGGNRATATDVANIADGPLAVTGATISTTVGTALAEALATFTDRGGAQPLADYSAAVNWGDGGTATAGTISGPDANGVFTISGSPSYTAAGTFTATVTVHHDGVTPDVTVQDAATVTGPLDFTSSGGDVTVRVANGTLQILAGTTVKASAPLADVASVTVAGADGVANKFTLDYTGGTFTVPGGITFNGGALPATPSNSLSILGGSFDVDTFDFQSAHDGSIQLGTSGQVVNYTNMTPLVNTGTAAQAVFKLPDGTVTASLDAGQAAGTVQLVSGNGSFETTTFPAPKTSLTVNAGNGSDTVTTGSNFYNNFNAVLTVQGAANTLPLHVSGTSTVTATAGTAFTDALATFIDPNGAGAASDYSATINWGDGATADAGSVTLNGGVFTASGTHTYATAGTMSPVVTIGHGSATPVTATATVDVASGTPFATSDAVYTIGSGTITVSAANGLLKNDTGPTALSVTAGTVTGAQGGTFVFKADGSFTYTPGASFPGYDSAPFTVSDAAGDKATQTVTVLSQHASVVWKFYESVLNRSPDSGGLQYWTNYFNGGGQTGQMAVGFFESTELLDKIITDYYQQYLLRRPDAAGLSFWVSEWQATGAPEGIKAGFADSPEFYKSAGGTPSTWLTALYQRILDRTPDPAGFQYWLNYYQQQTAVGGAAGDVQQQIALGFFESAEAYRDDVTGWFNEYLGRNPTSSEQSQYASQMEGGATDRTIEQEITNLPEYANNPPAPADGAASPLPDYYQAAPQTQAALAAKDTLFASL